MPRRHRATHAAAMTSRRSAYLVCALVLLAGKLARSP